MFYFWPPSRDQMFLSGFGGLSALMAGIEFLVAPKGGRSTCKRPFHTQASKRVWIFLERMSLNDCFQS